MSTEQSSQEKTCVVIVEGLGISNKETKDAYQQADAPTLKSFEESQDGLFTTLKCNGKFVGVNEEKPGTAGLGYLTLGTGSITERQIFRINKKIDNGTFFVEPKLLEAMENVKAGNGRLHLIGQITDSYEQSCLKHLDALLKVCHDQQVPHVYVHGILGDTDEKEKIGAENVAKVEEMMEKYSIGEFSTICGTIYAYSEKKEWDYIKQYYECLVAHTGRHCEGMKMSEYIQSLYDKGENDETMAPVYVSEEGSIKDNDVVILFNSKSSSSYRILLALVFMCEKAVQEQSPLFETALTPKPVLYTFVYYSSSVPCEVIFNEDVTKNSIIDTLSKEHYKTAIICEKARDTFATFLFSGSKSELPPAFVDTFVPNSIAEAVKDTKQELSMKSVAFVAKQLMLKKSYSCLFTNLNSIGLYAELNDFNILKGAIETTDKIVKDLYDACKIYGYRFVLVSTDCSCNLVDEMNGTTNALCDVPFYIQKRENEELAFKEDMETKTIANFANTLLTLLHLKNEPEMCESLI